MAVTASATSLPVGHWDGCRSETNNASAARSSTVQIMSNTPKFHDSFSDLDNTRDSIFLASVALSRRHAERFRLLVPGVRPVPSVAPAVS